MPLPLRYTIATAAAVLGTSKQSLKRWQKLPDFPVQVRRCRALPNGKPGARWYSAEDVAKIREWKWPGSYAQTMTNSPVRHLTAPYRTSDLVRRKSL
jgi:hypothetical protein